MIGRWAAGVGLIALACGGDTTSPQPGVDDVAKYVVTASVVDPPAGTPIVVSAQAVNAFLTPVSVSGRVVTWTVSHGTGGSFAQVTSTTDANGLATATFTPNTTPGTAYQLKATDDHADFGETSLIITQTQVTIATFSDGVGAYSTCAIATDGLPWCWGQDKAQPGGTIDRSLPGKLATPTTYTSLSTGLSHTCGVENHELVWCWGTNDNGELGDNTFTSHTIPTATSLLQSYSVVSAGDMHTCAIVPTQNGSAYCWGSNANGRLGIGPTPALSQAPVQVAQGQLVFTSVSAGGSHTCALATNGDVYCWGSNTQGQLGNGSTTDANVPTAVTAGGIAFTSISAGQLHTCALTAAGVAYCWGMTLPSPSTVPVVVTGGPTFVSISAGGSHTCAIATDATAWCWGVNESGELGDGTFTTNATPRRVSGGLSFASIAAGGMAVPLPAQSFSGNTCGVTTAGVAFCWGSNNHGQLGIGPSPTKSNVPVKVLGQH